MCPSLMPLHSRSGGGSVEHIKGMSDAAKLRAQMELAGRIINVEDREYDSEEIWVCNVLALSYV